jgi:hypothetical protein
MKYKDVMLDLETWGKGTNAVVVQIGAAYFDRDTKHIGDTFNKHIDAESEMAKGFRADADTLYWWLSQHPDAQTAAMGVKRNRVQSSVAWTALNNFLSGAENIWCHATFDFPIVSVHNRHLGIKPSYKYWAPKDLRSIVEAAKIDTRKYKKKPGNLVLHSAIDDCVLQIDYLVDALRELGVVPPLDPSVHPDAHKWVHGTLPKIPAKDEAEYEHIDDGDLIARFNHGM